MWRDLQVVGQAATLAPEWYPIGGRAFLGLDPGPRSQLERSHVYPERSEVIIMPVGKAAMTKGPSTTLRTNTKP